MKRDIWARRRGLCDRCNVEGVPVAFFQGRHGLQMRLCRDCLAEATKKVDQEDDKPPPIETQGLP